MRLLLDTHAFLWWWVDDDRLLPKTRALISHADEVFVSAASTWEMAIKLRLGKLKFQGRFDEAVSTCGFTELPVRSAHSELVRALPQHHRDPFDRMLISQALLERLSLVSCDEAMNAYDVAVVWA
ncbi:MAG: type II toxin-antitoxin system VapC family toxin [Polyangiaceae bacterium]|nr:type II toxin-antitoxin system VapC family toxin [Polyangiaceae bacterium]